LSAVEQEHIISAISFELSIVKREEIRLKTLENLQYVDANLAGRVAINLGLELPQKTRSDYPKAVSPSPALSQLNQPTGSLKTRVVAILVADGADGVAIATAKAAIEGAGGIAKIIGLRFGTVHVTNGKDVKVDGTVATCPSVAFDGVFIPGGASIVLLNACGAAVHFVLEAFAHLKAIAGNGEAEGFLQGIRVIKGDIPVGVFVTNGSAVTDDLMQKFIAGVGQHRFYNRTGVEAIPM